LRACGGLALAQSDMQFAQEAAIGGMTEVELGKLAVKNGESPQVKSLGQRMIDDHSKANQELKSIAAKNNITLPTDLDAKHKAMVDKMSSMSGASFDQAYIQGMVKDHQEDITLFQKEAKSGTNVDLKTWAGATMPTLQDHLRATREAQNSMSASKSSR
jgi:putative membrane protein